MAIGRQPLARSLPIEHTKPSFPTPNPANLAVNEVTLHHSDFARVRLLLFLLAAVCGRLPPLGWRDSRRSKLPACLLKLRSRSASAIAPTPTTPLCFGA